MAMWHLMMGFGIGLLATILTVIASQRQHRALIQSTKSTFISLPGEKCVICLADMANDEMVYVKCGHAFHDQCLKNLRRYQDNKCPTCRAII